MSRRAYRKSKDRKTREEIREAQEMREAAVEEVAQDEEAIEEGAQDEEPEMKDKPEDGKVHFTEMDVAEIKRRAEEAIDAKYGYVGKAEERLDAVLNASHEHPDTEAGNKGPEDESKDEGPKVKEEPKAKEEPQIEEAEPKILVVVYYLENPNDEDDVRITASPWKLQQWALEGLSPIRGYAWKIKNPETGKVEYQPLTPEEIAKYS